MTYAASALRAAAFCLHMPINLAEVNDGIEWVEAAIAALPPGTDPELVRVIEKLDWRQLEAIADQLGGGGEAGKNVSPHSEVSKPAKPRRQRKPSLRTLIAQAEKAGKPVSSVTTPDGVTLKFGESAPAEAVNPWLADLDRVTKQ